MTCPFVRDDGAYVLGALTPAERLDFERHLADCPDCSRRVQELAGLTGLLARVSPQVMDDQSAEDVPPVPDSVLSSLLGDVRRERRRRRWLAAGLAAAAVVAGAAIGALGSGIVGGDAAGGPEATSPTASQAPSAVPSTEPSPAPSSGTPSATPSAAPSPSPALAPARRMRPVAETTMTARVSLTAVPWGTRLDLTCSYPWPAPTGRGEASYDDGEGTTYTLVVRTRRGEVAQVATWRARAGTTTRLTGATAAVRGSITAVQVRIADGSPVLQLRG